MSDNPINLARIHHAVIICRNYERSKVFYRGVLGLKVVRENYRCDRESWKLALALPDGGQIELFSIPEPPARHSGPGTAGLHHLAFAAPELDARVSVH